MGFFYRNIIRGRLINRGITYRGRRLPGVTGGNAAGNEECRDTISSSSPLLQLSHDLEYIIPLSEFILLTLLVCVMEEVDIAGKLPFNETKDKKIAPKVTGHIWGKVDESKAQIRIWLISKLVTHGQQILPMYRFKYKVLDDTKGYHDVGEIYRLANFTPQKANQYALIKCMDLIEPLFETGKYQPEILVEDLNTWYQLGRDLHSKSMQKQHLYPKLAALNLKYPWVIIHTTPVKNDDGTDKKYEVYQ